MIAAFLLAAVTIAFPKPGTRLPYLERCHLRGATSGGETNLVIQGRNVPVYRTGAWVAMVDCVEGTNVVDVAGTNISFFVMRKPQPKPASAATNAPAAKPYAKLPYAGDAPRPQPWELEPRPQPSELTIVVDPGHGGDDTGALSPHGIPEKDANLRLAAAVRAELVRLGYQVILTRDDDRFVKLYDRPKIAHAVRAAAFVSIHHNAPPADRNPYEFRYHAVFAWNEIGLRLGAAVNRRLAEAIGPEVADNGVPQANFAVTRSPEIPSCLVETDFITTPEGEEACWDPARRLKVARAIAAGIADWCAGKR